MSATIVDFLRSSVERWPESDAVVDVSRRVCYARLWDEAQAIARHLRDNGLKPQGRVALLLQNSGEYVAAYYGVLMAGGVVVALNIAARARDLVNWMLHSDARWIIADWHHGDLNDVLRGVGPRVQLIALNRGECTADLENGVRVSDWHNVIEAGKSGRGFDASLSNDMAAIIYTSGTTGKPKGVVLSHANLAANVESILAYLKLGNEDRCLNVLPFYYSYGNSVLHTHMAAGGTVILENSLAYVHNVVSRMSTEGATGFSGVPSTYALLLTRVKLEDYDLKSLRYVTQAGGAMAPAQIARLRRSLPHTRLFVMYGQTEATARLSYLPPERLDEKLGSAGIAIPGVRLEICDDGGRPVAPGTVGEICASGANIMAGYWKDEEATRDVLRNGWLRTGDLAYMDDEGFIFIKGRSSEMIKTGAHRINPREIEEVVEECEGVAEVAVVGVPDDILGQAIKAVIVPRSGMTLSVMAVKAHCRSALASYKVPHAVQFVTQIPKTASGKIQRYLLASESPLEQSVDAKETL